MNEHGPYTATFVGGPLDGETLEVQSLQPSRIVFPHDRTPRAWDGKPPASRPAVVYDIDRPDESNSCTYRHARTLT